MERRPPLSALKSGGRGPIPLAGAGNSLVGPVLCGNRAALWAPFYCIKAPAAARFGRGGKILRCKPGAGAGLPTGPVFRKAAIGGGCAALFWRDPVVFAGKTVVYR